MGGSPTEWAWPDSATSRAEIPANCGLFVRDGETPVRIGIRTTDQIIMAAIAGLPAIHSRSFADEVQWRELRCWLRPPMPSTIIWSRTLLNVTAQFGIAGHVPDFRLITSLPIRF